MAKSPRASGPDPAAVLEGLRKALSGPKPLLGKDDALFASAAKGKALAQAAIDQGYLITRTETMPPSGRQKKGKEVLVAELTEKGRQHVVELDSPKSILQALLPRCKPWPKGRCNRSRVGLA